MVSTSRPAVPPPGAGTGGKNAPQRVSPGNIHPHACLHAPDPRGAFATSRHFEDVAEYLRDQGYETLLFDHRGVGRNGPCLLENQSAELLAEDALALINHVWGPQTSVHIFGCVWVARRGTNCKQAALAAAVLT